MIETAGSVMYVYFHVPVAELALTYSLRSLQVGREMFGLLRPYVHLWGGFSGLLNQVEDLGTSQRNIYTDIFGYLLTIVMRINSLTSK